MRNFDTLEVGGYYRDACGRIWIVVIHDYVDNSFSAQRLYAPLRTGIGSQVLDFGRYEFDCNGHAQFMSGDNFDLIERVNADGSTYVAELHGAVGDGVADDTEAVSIAVGGGHYDKPNLPYDPTSLGSMINEVRRLAGVSGNKPNFGKFLELCGSVPIMVAFNQSLRQDDGSAPYIAEGPEHEEQLYRDLEAYHNAHKIVTEVTDFS